MIDTTAATIAANGGSRTFASLGSNPTPAPITTKITNAPQGFDIAPGSNLSGTYNATGGNLTKTSDTVSPTPVITAKAAQDDYNQKYTTFQNLLNSIKSQSTALSQAQAYQAEQKAAADLQASQLKLEQQGIDLKKAEVDAKNFALNLAQGTPQKTASDTTDTTTPVSAGLGNTQTQPNNASQSTPAPQVGDSTAATGLSSAVDTKVAGINQIQDARDSLTQQSNTLLSSLMAGTIPLSAPQQALITSLQNQLALNEADQRQANAAFVGQVSEAAFRAGGEYTPEQMSGQIHTAISAGVAKIQALDNSAAKTIADLEQSYQKDNFEIINKQFDNLTKDLDAKSSAIKDTYDTVTKALQDQRDYKTKVQEFNQQEADKQKDQDLAIKKFNLDVSNSAIDNKIKLANSAADLTLKRAQVAKIYSDMTSADTASAQNWAKLIQSGQAKLSEVPKSLQNAVASSLANGTPQGTNALLATTQKSIQELNDMVNNDTGADFLPGITLPGMTTGFRGAVGVKGISSLFGAKGHPFAGSAAANFDAKLKQVTNDVVLPNLTILHGLGRVTDREFQALQSSVTSLNPDLSESEFKNELKNITDRVNALATENDPTTRLQSFYTANPQNASQIDTLRKANPTMTPDQILQLVQP